MARSRGSGSRIISRGGMRGGSPIQFLQETIGELRKAVWPTREETWHLTWIVIIISGVAAGLLGLLDFVLTRTFGRYVIGS